MSEKTISKSRFNGGQEVLTHRAPIGFTDAIWEALSWAAQRSNLDRSELIRRLVLFYVARAKAFEAEHPELTWLEPAKVLAAYYKAGELKMQAERVKADEQLAEYQRLQEIDGGLAAVDFKTAPKVMAFVHRCWAGGKSWKAELAEMEQAIGELAGRLEMHHGLQVELDDLGNLRPELPEPPTLTKLPDPAYVHSLKDELSRCDWDRRAWRAVAVAGWGLAALVLGLAGWLAFAR